MSGWCHKCGHVICICKDEWRGTGDAAWRVEMLAKDEQIRSLTARLAAAEAEAQTWKDQCGELAAELSVMRLKYEGGCL